MEMLPNESAITESGSGEVILTTHRIRLLADNTLISIMLNQVSSIRVLHASKPLYLIIAIVLGGSGVVALEEADGTIAILLIVVAVILIFLYIDSRKHIVSIASSSTAITFHTKGMKKEAIFDFVDKVERAIAG